MAVLARGRLDVYEARRARYQLLVEIARAARVVTRFAVYSFFEQLKKKLEPGRTVCGRSGNECCRSCLAEFGIVTSAVRARRFRTCLQILSRRFPGLHIRIYPAQVQGEGFRWTRCAAGSGIFPNRIGPMW